MQTETFDEALDITTRTTTETYASGDIVEEIEEGYSRDRTGYEETVSYDASGNPVQERSFDEALDIATRTTTETYASG